jgi:hypothetical protein
MTEITFAELGIPIPPLVKEQPLEQQQQIYDYLKTLDDKQKKTYLIAFKHLGTSFNIYRSNGFREWVKTKTNK